MVICTTERSAVRSWRSSALSRRWCSSASAWPVTCVYSRVMTARRRSRGAPDRAAAREGRRDSHRRQGDHRARQPADRARRSRDHRHDRSGGRHGATRRAGVRDKVSQAAGVVRGVRAVIMSLLHNRITRDNGIAGGHMAYEYDRFETGRGGGSFLMGLLAGTVLGAGLGMLFAPEGGLGAAQADLSDRRPDRQAPRGDGSPTTSRRRRRSAGIRRSSIDRVARRTTRRRSSVEQHGRGTAPTGATTRRRRQHRHVGTRRPAPATAPNVTEQQARTTANVVMAAAALRRPPVVVYDDNAARLRRHRPGGRRAQYCIVRTPALRRRPAVARRTRCGHDPGAATASAPERGRRESAARADRAGTSAGTRLAD